MNQIKIDKIIRSRRKSIALVISPDATLVVRAPLWISLEYIKNLVFKKRFWIRKKQQQVLRNGGLARAKEFTDGEEFLYLGETYKLRIQNREDIKLADYLYFPEKHLNLGRAKMIEWYRERAREIITERANWYSQMTGWKFKSISITTAKRRWGSCGPNGSINFSFRLVMAPRSVIDYVVAHELAHIPEKNHSAIFWDKVRMVLPDYKIRRKWLREKERSLNI